MTNDSIKALSDEIVEKIDKIKKSTEDAELRKRMDDLYYNLKRIESVALTQGQLTNEKEQENMNLKKEIELLKYSLDFAMGKDKADAQEVLEAQAVKGMNQKEEEKENTNSKNENEDTDEFGIKEVLREMNNETIELKSILRDSSRDLDDIYLDTLKIANNTFQQRKVMVSKNSENLKLKKEIDGLQLALDYATGKIEQGPVEEEAAVEMHTEEMERKFM